MGPAQAQPPQRPRAGATDSASSGESWAARPAGGPSATRARPQRGGSPSESLERPPQQEAPRQRDRGEDRTDREVLPERRDQPEHREHQQLRHDRNVGASQGRLASEPQTVLPDWSLRLQPEGEHDEVRALLVATELPVEGERRGIVMVGEHPGLAAGESTRMIEHPLQDARSDAAVLPGTGDTDLVDPELARLVWMPVVDTRDEADRTIVAMAATK